MADKSDNRPLTPDEARRMFAAVDEAREAREWRLRQAGIERCKDCGGVIGTTRARIEHTDWCGCEPTTEEGRGDGDDRS